MKRHLPFERKAYLIGGGIASLACAAYLIKDGRLPGKDITIFEEGRDLGGSLDAKKSGRGYVMRGYRMFEGEIYTCMFDLMSFIPSATNPGKTLMDEFLDFNFKHRIYSKCRLVENRGKINSYDLGLSVKDRIRLTKIISLPESALGKSTIRDNFSPDFFRTNYWYENCTGFAFQPWHSAAEFRRYMRRFLHDALKASTLTLIKSTPYNQYDSLVVPLARWLKQHGVKFESGAKVTDLSFEKHEGKKRVNEVRYSKSGKMHNAKVNIEDFVFVTLGSMTSNSTIGSMDSPPKTDSKKSASWKLWEDLSREGSEFGRPQVFNRNIAKSNFVGFTVTAEDNVLPSLIEKFTGNKSGQGGIVTFKDSNWLLSIIVPHQPHFINQPKGKTVFWGYGLSTAEKGNHVKKRMLDCNGKEILKELCLHFGFENELPEILRTSDCIPSFLPYTTSQFFPRKDGDRPNVVPENTHNFAILGQFCEIPDEVTFTVEYSVRSAQIAVYSLLGLDKQPSKIYHGWDHLKVWNDALGALFRKNGPSGRVHTLS